MRTSHCWLPILFPELRMFGRKKRAQTKQMERCLTPSLTLAFVGQGHEKDLAQEHEGKQKAGRRAGVSDRRAQE